VNHSFKFKKGKDVIDFLVDSRSYSRALLKVNFTVKNPVKWNGDSNKLPSQCLLSFDEVGCEIWHIFQIPHLLYVRLTALSRRLSCSRE